MNVLLICCVNIVCANQLLAQDSPLKIGGGLVFSTGALDVDEIDNTLGIRGEGIYSINDKIRAAADFTFFFPKKEGDVKATVMGINLNGNYIFYKKEKLMAYGLAGLNVAIINVDIPDVNVPGYGNFGGSDSESEFGLNLGGGVEYALDFADLFGELRLAGVGGDANQFILGVGLRFSI